MSSVGVLVKQLPDKIIFHFGDLALDLAGFKRGAIKKIYRIAIILKFYTPEV